MGTAWFALARHAMETRSGLNTTQKSTGSYRASAGRVARLMGEPPGGGTGPPDRTACPGPAPSRPGRSSCRRSPPRPSAAQSGAQRALETRSGLNTTQKSSAAGCASARRLACLQHAPPGGALDQSPTLVPGPAGNAAPADRRGLGCQTPMRGGMMPILASLRGEPASFQPTRPLLRLRRDGVI